MSTATGPRAALTRGLRIVGGEDRLDGLERGEARERRVVERRVRADDLDGEARRTAHAARAGAGAGELGLDGARLGGGGAGAQKDDHRSASTIAQTAKARLT